MNTIILQTSDAVASFISGLAYTVYRVQSYKALRVYYGWCWSVLLVQSAGDKRSLAFEREQFERTFKTFDLMDERGMRRGTRMSEHRE